MKRIALSLLLTGCFASSNTSQYPAGYEPVPNANNFAITCSESHNDELYQTRLIGRAGIPAQFTRPLTAETAQSDCAKRIVAACPHGYHLNGTWEGNGTSVIYTGYCYCGGH